MTCLLKGRAREHNGLVSSIESIDQSMQVPSNFSMDIDLVKALFIHKSHMTIDNEITV